MTAMNQHFIPVIDDNRIFIGIVTRRSIISYCFDRYTRAAEESAAAGSVLKSKKQAGAYLNGEEILVLILVFLKTWC